MCLTSAEGRKKNESFDLFITKLSINQPAYRNMETGHEMGNYCYNHNLWLAVSKKKKTCTYTYKYTCAYFFFYYLGPN